MAGIASTHPYSTAFLMGAALSGSILAGAAVARVAMTRVGANAVRSGAGGGGGVVGGAGSGAGGSRAFASVVAKPRTQDPTVGQSMPQGRGTTAVAADVGAGTAPATAKGEYDTRLARLETFVREMHIQQKGFLDTIVSSQPRIAVRLARIEDSLAADAAKKNSANGAGLTKVSEIWTAVVARYRKRSGAHTHTPQLDDRLAGFETLLREMHIRQKGFLDTIISAQPSISARLGKIEETLVADAEAKKAASTADDDLAKMSEMLNTWLDSVEDKLSSTSEMVREVWGSVVLEGQPLTIPVAKDHVALAWKEIEDG
jgi:hypothetical protein